MSTEHTADEVSTVREATGDDLDAVLRVGHRTWPVTYGPVAGDEYVAMGLAKWWTADAVIPAIRAGRALVAQVGDEVVGVATYGTGRAQMAFDSFRTSTKRGRSPEAWANLAAHPAEVFDLLDAWLGPIAEGQDHILLSR